MGGQGNERKVGGGVRGRVLTVAPATPAGAAYAAGMELGPNKNMNIIYRRSESNWIGSTGNPKDAGINYWRKQAREVFARHTGIEIVEIVKTGRKTDSQVLLRGHRAAPSHAYVIVASTGGSWGRSRRDYPPVA